MSLGQAIIVKKGVWHATPFPEKNKVKFLVTFKRNTMDNDFEIRELEETLKLTSEKVMQ